MMDFKRYYRLRPQGLCHTEKYDDGFVVKFKRFDNESGKELTPEPNYITEEGLLNDRADLLEKISAINSILEEIQQIKK